MKKIVRILVVSLLLFVGSIVTVSAETEKTFNPYVEIVEEDGCTSVIVSDESDEVLENNKPKLEIPVSYSKCYVTLDDEDVAYTFENSIVSFEVTKGGTYIIVEGEKPAEQDEGDTTESHSTTKHTVVNTGIN